MWYQSGFFTGGLHSENILDPRGTRPLSFENIQRMVFKKIYDSNNFLS